MSERELGQIAYEAFMSAEHSLIEERWESAAQAVAARAREECARIADEKALDLDKLANAMFEGNTRAQLKLRVQDARDVAFEIRAMNEASHG